MWDARGSGRELALGCASATHTVNRGYRSEMIASTHLAPTAEDVRAYWEKNPLYSYEPGEPGSLEFCQRLDAIKHKDVERFTLGSMVYFHLSKP